MKSKPAKATKKSDARQAAPKPVIATKSADTKSKSEPRDEATRTFSTLREAILAEMVEVEETEYATGFNNGLREAIQRIDAWAKMNAVDGADEDINALSLEDLRAAYRELRERHAVRITEALAKLSDKGEKTGGDEPYGYKLGPDKKTLVEREREQAVVAEVLRLRAAGSSLIEIQRELHEKGMKPRVPRPKDGVVRKRKEASKRKRPDGYFDTTQIRRIIEWSEGRGVKPMDADRR